MVILAQVESAILASVTPVTDALSLTLATHTASIEENEEEDEMTARIASLQERLTSLQQQVRQLSVTESRRLYELLQAQQASIEEEQAVLLDQLMEEVKKDEQVKMQERIAERIARIEGRYHNGRERMLVCDDDGQ